MSTLPFSVDLLDSAGKTMTLSLAYKPDPPPTPVQSLLRGLFINQAAGTVLKQSDMAGYEVACLQPQQIAGYTKAANGTASLPGAPTMADLKSWMPTAAGLAPQVLCYINAMRETGYDRSTPPFWMPYNPQANWYLYDIKGQKIMDGTPNPLMSPKPGGWRSYQGQKLDTILADKNGWTTVFWDVLSLFSMRGGPVNPATGQLYTPGQWIADLANMGAFLQTGVGNSLESAAKYAQTGAILTYPLFAGMAEQYLRNPADPVDSFPGTNNTGTYAQHVAMIDDVCRNHGGTFYGIVKVWTTPPPTAAQADNWERLCAGVALMGMQKPGSVVVTYEAAANDTAAYPVLAPVIGTPVDLTRPGQFSPLGERRFTNGLVLVNPTAQNIAYQLGISTVGHWTEISGAVYPDGTVVSVPANNALMLRDY